MTKVALKTLRPYQEELVRRAKCLGNWAYYDAKNKEISYVTRRACYASLGDEGKYDEFLKPKQVDAWLDWCWATHEKLRANKKFEKHEREYIDWLVNHSPWAPCFRVKSVKEIEQLPMVYDVSFPTKFIVQAACALRNVKENPQVVENWHFLYKKGVQGTIAMFLSHFIILSDKRFFPKESPTSGIGHGIGTPELFNGVEIKRVFNRDWNKEHCKLPFSKLRNCRSVYDLYRGEKGVRYRDRGLIVPEGLPQKFTVFGHKFTEQGVSDKQFDEWYEDFLKKNNLKTLQKEKY